MSVANSATPPPSSEQVLGSLFIAAQEEMDLLQKKVIDAGNLELRQEHRHAMDELEEVDSIFYSFEEYVKAAWSKERVNTKYATLTLHQWMGYLIYLKNLMKRFSQPNLLPSENKKQAQSLLEDIQKWINIISKQLTHMSELYNELYQLQIKEMLSGEKDKFFYQLKTKFELEIVKNIQSLDEMTDAIARGLKEHQNYWKKNLERFFNRESDITTIISLERSNQKPDLLFRNMSEGEFQEIVRMKQFTQGPTSFEREKWFYQTQANPGNSVLHPIKCKIYLLSGSLKVLQELMKQDRLFAAVVSKDAEPYCFGIHEDALAAFNSLVEKIEFTQNTGKKLGEVTFDRTLSLKAMPSFTRKEYMVTTPTLSTMYKAF